MSGRAPVIAIVVAYNRRSLLAEVLDALAAQTVPPTRVLVVDNASADGSAELAEAHPIGATVLHVARNTGGAGGFAIGIAVAAEDTETEAFWLMDDDTVPSPTALAELLAVRAALPRTPAVLGSRVVWTDGSDHPMNRPRRRPGAPRSALEDTLGVAPVRSSSFVSMLVDASAARETALPLADYFIWNDDFEYSTRLLRDGEGYFCQRSVVVHKTGKLGATDSDPGDRFYFEVRNKLWLFRHSRGLAAGERVLYFGSTLRRWLRTYRRSGDRARLRATFRRGLRDGLFGAPRPTATVLAGLGDASELVARFEAKLR